MRRTLALLGAAALAVTGLAGPANASDINAQADLIFASSGFNNTGVLVDTSAPNNETWYDIRNPTGINESLEGLNVIGCIAGAANPVVFMSATDGYVATDVVPANGIFRTADQNYSGSDHDLRWTGAPSGTLHSETFRLVLYEISSFNGIDATESNPSGLLDPNCTAQLPPV